MASASLYSSQTAQSPKQEAVEAAIAADAKFPFPDAVNALGMETFGDVYADDVNNQNGRVTVYVGPNVNGDRPILIAAIQSLASASTTSDTFTIVNVPASMDTLTALAQRVMSAGTTEQAAGFSLGGTTPDPVNGQIDVTLLNASANASLAAAQAYFLAQFGPDVIVQSNSAAPANFLLNRHDDVAPYTSGDQIY